MNENNMFEKFISCKDEKIVVLANGIINKITMECYYDYYFKDYICNIYFESIDNGSILWDHKIAFKSTLFMEFYFENLLLFFDANKDRFESLQFHSFEEIFDDWHNQLSKYNRILKLLTTKPNKLNKEIMRLNYGF